MWLPSKVFELLHFNRDEVTKLRTERDSLRDELSRLSIINDFFRLQVNSLQMERTQLLDKAYGIKVPTPILEKTPPQVTNASAPDAIFEDMGDEWAKKLGLPVYGN